MCLRCSDRPCRPPRCMRHLGCQSRALAAAPPGHQLWAASSAQKDHHTPCKRHGRLKEYVILISTPACLFPRFNSNRAGKCSAAAEAKSLLHEAQVINKCNVRLTASLKIQHPAHLPKPHPAPITLCNKATNPAAPT